MRHTEFWTRMESVLGPSYAKAWAGSYVIAALGGRTAEEALAGGEPPKAVWAAVREALELPASER